ncbi:tyrosine-protein phosphatase non-receptor type substrate 1-like [Protopterus annectens]|uniref:tyrosine-protein phosphatase non-receptor type substrate 1-like n=1 Tax=Protopterus annectens TaxID=7888 RepID=UPI001CFA8DC5|nr:tyrosine-protein phosphatase non-receptor type substrate 1-like [Protopterus annectens]
MNCTLSEESLGPVRWYKGGNQQQQLLYSQSESEKPDPRVNRTVKEGPTRETDQSIAFTLIRLEDAGVYYCVKFKSDKVTVAANGSGTHLYVNSTTGLTIYQTPSVTVREGDTAIMNCTLSEESLGPVRWYKGSNHQQQLLYSQSESEKPDPRVNKTVKEGPTRETDHSITFTFIRLEDAGVYYCVKFKSDKVTVTTNGSGTHLYVNRIPSPPSISGPTKQIMLNENVTLSCTSDGFYPKEINITWLQNGKEVLNSTKVVYLNMANKGYHVQSNVSIQAKIDSPVICRITHTALELPITSTFQMNNITKGPPHPSVSGPRDRVLLNTNVTLTCTSSGFYPSNISVTWWKNGTELPNPKKAIHLYGEDKTYRVQSNITVLAEIDSTVTCKINHTALDKPLHSAFNINDIVKGFRAQPELSWIAYYMS